MTLTLLPFNTFQGRIYRSPMPFGPYDPQGQALDEMLENEVHVVVMLASDDEALRKAGCDLRERYQAEGLQVIHLPIPDFSVPDREELDRAVEQAIELAKQGKNLVVHCSAGQGRTGLFLTEMAKRALNLPGREALAWVRQYVPYAVETEEQVRFVVGDS